MFRRRKRSASVCIIQSVNEFLPKLKFDMNPKRRKERKNSLECFRSWFGNRPSCFEENPTTERKWFRQVNTMLLRSLPLEVWLAWSSLSCHLALPFWSLKLYPCFYARELITETIAFIMLNSNLLKLLPNQYQRGFSIQLLYHIVVGAFKQWPLEAQIEWLHSFRTSALITFLQHYFTADLFIDVFSCFRWTWCHSEEDLHKMGEQTSKEGKRH